MKKILIVLICYMIIFAACGDDANSDNKSDGSTTLTITNSTDFNGIQPFYGDVDFGMLNRGQSATKEVDYGTNYLYLMLTAMSTAQHLGEHTSMWGMTEVVTCEEKQNTTLTITNNTTVEFGGGNSGYETSGGATTGTLKTLFDAYIQYNNDL